MTTVRSGMKTSTQELRGIAGKVGVLDEIIDIINCWINILKYVC